VKGYGNPLHTLISFSMRIRLTLSIHHNIRAPPDDT
jgi:hypothetical protein